MSDKQTKRTNICLSLRAILAALKLSIYSLFSILIICCICKNLKTNHLKNKKQAAEKRGRSQSWNKENYSDTAGSTCKRNSTAPMHALTFTPTVPLLSYLFLLSAYRSKTSYTVLGLNFDKFLSYYEQIYTACQQNHISDLLAIINRNGYMVTFL